jgi:excisionase family DNA binding protein
VPLIEKHLSRSTIYSQNDLHKGATAMKNLLTVKEAANELGVKPCTIRAWLLVGKLAYVRYGRTIRVPMASIERFVHESTVPMKEER